MRGISRWLLLSAAILALLAIVAGASADPGEPHADEIVVPPPSQPQSPPGMQNMSLLGVQDKDGTINSDIAFYGNLAYVGNYDGFRIIDISDPTNMQVLSDTRCRANQGDVSVFKGRDGRMWMLQSIDRAVMTAECPSADTPTVTEQDEFGVTWARGRFGYEGLRLFDVTDPRNPQYKAFYRTECGSHTHTLVPDPKRRMVHAYVASYPLLSQITPQIDRAQAEAMGLNCDAPHSVISVVSLPLGDPTAGTVRKETLSSDTEPYDHDGPATEHTHPDGTTEWHGTAPPFVACHDFQAFMPRDIAVASCAGDAQYWDISKPGDPSAGDGERHTHIQREVREDDPSTPENERWESFDFMHNATVSWDGKVAAIVDEAGGGVAARCDGGDTKRGFTWFYPLVKPGKPVDGFDELGRYVIPRPQGSEICVSHNGNVLPLENGRDWQVQAFYQGGNTLLDFTRPDQPAELGFADLSTPGVGDADSWSTYWYNDVMYVNGGLGGRSANGNRGFEAYSVFHRGRRVKTDDWKWLNPQTQEEWQAPDDDDDDDD
jgi:LVIVD repeat